MSPIPQNATMRFIALCLPRNGGFCRLLYLLQLEVRKRMEQIADGAERVEGINHEKGLLIYSFSSRHAAFGVAESQYPDGCYLLKWILRYCFAIRRMTERE
jgi:hypothetical protein